MEKINYKKSLGQNFLYDNNVLNNICNSVDVGEDDLIIEIGAGSGNLTRKLKDYNAQIIAFEIDESLKCHLNGLIDSKTEILFEDILDADLKGVLKNKKYNKLFIIANIPYYITTPIIEKIIKEDVNPSKIVLMVQKEVALRLSSKPATKEYGYITVLFNYYYSIKQLFIVKKTSFKPIPKVDSAVIELTPTNHYVKDTKKFDSLLKNAFRFKRKTIKNNLNCYDLNMIEGILEKYNLNLSSRAEEIPLELFIEIANNL